MQNAPKMPADAYQVGGNHYKQMAIEPWAIMEAVMPREQFIGYLRGNVLKYALRAGHKEGSDDGEKARHYLAKLAEVEATEAPAASERPAPVPPVKSYATL